MNLWDMDGMDIKPGRAWLGFWRMCFIQFLYYMSFDFIFHCTLFTRLWWWGWRSKKKNSIQDPYFTYVVWSGAAKYITKIFVVSSISKNTATKAKKINGYTLVTPSSSKRLRCAEFVIAPLARTQMQIKSNRSTETELSVMFFTAHSLRSERRLSRAYRLVPRLLHSRPCCIVWTISFPREWKRQQQCGVHPDCWKGRDHPRPNRGDRHIVVRFQVSEDGGQDPGPPSNRSWFHH